MRYSLFTCFTFVVVGAGALFGQAATLSKKDNDTTEKAGGLF